MRLRRVLCGVGLLVGLLGIALVAQDVAPAGVKMTAAAEKFLSTLTPEQRQKATFRFDDKERYNWHFIPLQDAKRNSTRKGLPLEAMTEAQRQAALDLLKAGLSDDGFKKARTIMSLEGLLHELEKGAGMVRNPDWYFFSIFGTPSKTGKWGYRVEGHHLALNFTLDGSKLVSATPTFLGANPATVYDGPRKDLRALAHAEDLANDLFLSLNEEQTKVAHQGSKHFAEVKAQNQLPEVGAPVGLPAAGMTGKQKGMLLNLLKVYTDNLAAEGGQPEMDRLKEAGIEKIHFAFSGSTVKGEPRTYRIQGPTFRVEFLNIQADSARNPANHIHTCWRSTSNDFGLGTR